MSWAEVKKINSDLKLPLDKLIKKNRIYLPGITLPDVWETKESMMSVRYGLTSTVVSGLIYCIGGLTTTYSKLNEVYNPKTGAWTSKAAITSSSRGYHSAAAVNGIIYCFGGNSSGTIVGTADAYNIATNTWSSKTAMITKRESFVACVVNGLIYCIGGRSSSSTSHSTNEVYNPTTNTWTAKADMPNARSGLGGAVVDNVIYCIGGLRDGFATYFQNNEAYDPATNTWSNKAIMPTARYLFGTAEANNGAIYCIGGTGSSGTAYNTTRVNEVYHVPTNTWSIKTPMPTGRYRHTAAAVDGVIFCIGGYAGSEGLAVNEAYRLPEIILCPVSKGDRVYSVTEIYTQTQTIAANTVTEILVDGYLYTKTDFVFGWIQKGD